MSIGINLCCVLYYGITSHIQNSKNVLYFKSYYQFHLWMKTPLQLLILYFSPVFFSKDTLGTRSGKIKYAYSKDLAQFCQEKTPTYGNQSFYYINGEERDSSLERGMYMSFITFLFQSNAIFLKQLQTLTVQYKGAFKPNLLPASCSLRSTCFGKQLEACQEKVIDLCLKSLSQLYTVRAYYKRRMLTRCSIS